MSLYGYTCALCRAFVPAGSWHTCPNVSYTNPPPVDPLTRIAAALERLAAWAEEDDDAGE